MTDQPRKRIRRSVEASKQSILETAERYLIAEGPNGVKVQRVAHDLGMTDAAVHYHFGNRDLLLEALLRFSGRRFVAELTAAIEESDETTFSISEAALLLSELYDKRGTARLAMWLTLSGWSPKGSGMLDPLVDWLHKTKSRDARAAGLPAPTKKESRKQIALLSAVTFTQALAGDAMLRSVSLTETSSDTLLSWVVDLLDQNA
jgi:AcrR family transcriptional regulator